MSGIKGGLKPLGMPKNIFRQAAHDIFGTRIRWDDGKDKNKLVPQADVDKWYRIAKTNGEAIEKIAGKLDKSEEEKVALVTAVHKLEEKFGKIDIAPQPKVNEDTPLKEIFNDGNYPQTEEDWDDLASESPTYAMDLRQRFLGRNKDFNKTASESIKILVENHPDMYMQNEDGSVKYTADGRPIFNKDSKKGKLWMQIATDPAFLKSAKAPQIIMENMEARLKKEEDKALKTKIDIEKEEKEKKRAKNVDKSQIAIDGNKPPEKPEEVEIKYENDAEKTHVTQAISSGYYKDERAYFVAKKRGIKIGYGRGGY